MTPPDNSTPNIMITWSDGSVDSGPDATNVLEQVCGGWNPPTVGQLRSVLAKRASIFPPTADESDLEFLYRLRNSGVIAIYEVDSAEWDGTSNFDPQPPSQK